MARITLRLPDDLDDEVEDYLGYNDTKSEFYRQAVQEKLNRLQNQSSEANAAESGTEQETEA